MSRAVQADLVKLPLTAFQWTKDDTQGQTRNYNP